ncbi:MULTISPECIES: molybdenum cofactor guanylyltransferase [unclassified Campylobacter]|uniref:molybdenum cofactor guanylyltransferase n=1 Tax=unclassified Campylobacter TaxID=2593542 RepID=UPI003D327DF1
MQKFNVCVILAGGKSSRMGQDKTLLPFGREPSMTHFLAKKMEQIFKEIYISSKSQKFNPPLGILTDDSDDFSPMLALACILEKFDDSVFIMPADMPFVSIECVNELAKFKDEFDVVVARDAKHRHSLCGFFNPKIANQARELYEKGEHKIGLLLSANSLKEVYFDDSSQFANVNNPDEYERALNAL